MGDVTMAVMLLWRATAASSKLSAGVNQKVVDFYAGQLKSAEFFIHSILPITMGKMNAILESNRTAVDITEAAF
jgi:hypothetical protein